MTPSRRMRPLGLLFLLAVIATMALAADASADVRVSRAELSGSQLRVEGTAIANRSITVNDVAMGNSDGSGQFKLQRDGFAKPSDCRIRVNDGSATAATAT